MQWDSELLLRLGSRPTTPKLPCLLLFVAHLLLTHKRLLTRLLLPIHSLLIVIHLHLLHLVPFLYFVCILLRLKLNLVFLALLMRLSSLFIIRVCNNFAEFLNDQHLSIQKLNHSLQVPLPFSPVLLAIVSCLLVCRIVLLVMLLQSVLPPFLMNFLLFNCHHLLIWSI